MADITRAEVASLIAEEYAGEVIKAAVQGSTALQEFPRIPMGTKVTHMPVLATLPEAQWVSDTDNTGIKPTSQATWQDKTLVAEEVAVILPIHENTLDDMTTDGLSELSGLGGQALGKKLDQAVYFGIDKPASWTSPDILAAATAAGQVYSVSATPGADDLYGAIMQAAEGIADVGLDATALAARRGLRFRLANLRDADGNLLLSGDQFAGLDTYWNRNGAWVSSSATALVSDPTTVRIGVRQDITVKFLDQATLGTGENQINLAERDMVALRFKARFAYVMGQPATSETGAAATGHAAITPTAGV